MKGGHVMKIRHVHEGHIEKIENTLVLNTPPQSGFYWIDANADDLFILQNIFNFHELAVEDCTHEEEQRPKLEIYDDHYFIVINSIRFDDEEIFLRSLSIFIGRYYVVTVTRQKLNEIRFIKPLLWQEEVSRPDMFTYLLMDLVVDNYFSVGNRIEEKIEQLEDDILRQTRKEHLEEIINLRSEILWLKKMLIAQRELLLKLSKRDLKLIGSDLYKYFSDLYENAVRVTETFDTFRDLMGNLREAYQTSLTRRANDIMYAFTAITVIFMPLTFITGFYGMNFKEFIGLDSPLGIPIVVSGMGIVVSIFWILMRHRPDLLIRLTSPKDATPKK
jgi:magnesium transporter